MRGEAVGQTDWAASWQVSGVDDEEWESLKQRLDTAYERTLATLPGTSGRAVYFRRRDPLGRWGCRETWSHEREDVGRRADFVLNDRHDLRPAVVALAERHRRGTR